MTSFTRQIQSIIPNMLAVKLCRIQVRNLNPSEPCCKIFKIEVVVFYAGRGEAFFNLAKLKKIAYMINDSFVGRHIKIIPGKLRGCNSTSFYVCKATLKVFHKHRSKEHT